MFLNRSSFSEIILETSRITILEDDDFAVVFFETLDDFDYVCAMTFSEVILFVE